MLQIILSILDEKDHELVTRLFNKYEKHLMNYAMRILNHEMDSEDCVINTFVKVMEHIDKYHRADDRYIERLLYITCKHEAINIYRKKQKDIEYTVSMTYTDEDSEMQEMELQDMNEDIQKLAITQHTQEVVRNLIKGMDAKYSEIIILRYVESMSNKEIAEVLNLTESTVSTRLSRAKQYIMQKGGEELYDLAFT